MKIKIENGKLIFPKGSELQISDTRERIKIIKKSEDAEFAKLCKYFKIGFNSEKADWLFDYIYNFDDDKTVEFK